MSLSNGSREDSLINRSLVDFCHSYRVVKYKMVSPTRVQEVLLRIMPMRMKIMPNAIAMDRERLMPKMQPQGRYPAIHRTVPSNSFRSILRKIRV